MNTAICRPVPLAASDCAGVPDVPSAVATSCDVPTSCACSEELTSRTCTVNQSDQRSMYMLVRLHAQLRDEMSAHLMRLLHHPQKTPSSVWLSCLQVITSTVTESGSAVGTPRRVTVSSSGQEVLLEQPALPPGAFGQYTTRDPTVDPPPDVASRCASNAR